MAETENVTFVDWKNAARCGLVDGGIRPAAARAIIDAAAENVEALLTRKLTTDLMRTFLASCDLELMAYARRHGTRMLANRR
jgi:hypothetical protein